MSETKPLGEKENSGETNADHAECDAAHNIVTPAVVKTRKFRDLFQSPSDSVMSPCSQKLGKTHVPHPSLLGM